MNDFNEYEIADLSPSDIDVISSTENRMKIQYDEDVVLIAYRKKIKSKF